MPRRLWLAVIGVAIVALVLHLVPADLDAQRGGGRAGGGARAAGGGTRSVARSSVSGGGAATAGRTGADRSTVNRGDIDRSTVNRGDIDRDVNLDRDINVNRDLNVHVDHNYGGWGYGCCYHPGVTAAAVTTAAVVTAAAIGSIVYTLPPACSAIVVGGITYQQCGSTWYQPQFVGSTVSYAVVSPPR